MVSVNELHVVTIIFFNSQVSRLLINGEQNYDSILNYFPEERRSELTCIISNYDDKSYELMSMLVNSEQLLTMLNKENPGVYKGVVVEHIITSVLPSADSCCCSVDQSYIKDNRVINNKVDGIQVVRNIMEM